MHFHLKKEINIIFYLHDMGNIGVKRNNVKFNINRNMYYFKFNSDAYIYDGQANKGIKTYDGKSSLSIKIYDANSIFLWI